MFQWNWRSWNEVKYDEDEKDNQGTSEEDKEDWMRTWRTGVQRGQSDIQFEKKKILDFYRN